MWCDNKNWHTRPKTNWNAESLTSKTTAVTAVGNLWGSETSEEEGSLNCTMRPTLVYIVKPINDIKKWKGDGEEHSGPLVYGVHVSQVRDLHFELRGASADAPLAGHPVPVQPTPEALAAAQWLAVLDAGAVVWVHGGLGVTYTREHLGATGLVPDFQGAEENIAVSINLRAERIRSDAHQGHLLSCCWHRGTRWFFFPFPVHWSFSVENWLPCAYWQRRLSVVRLSIPIHRSSISHSSYLLIYLLLLVYHSSSISAIYLYQSAISINGLSSSSNDLFTFYVFAYQLSACIH